MAINPINPNIPVLAPFKVQRDENPKRNPSKQQAKKDKAKPGQQPADHVDEIV